MENVVEDKPISIYVPYAFLVAALLSIFVMSLNKVDLKPYETEYPAEAFLSPEFELSTLVYAASIRLYSSSTALIKITTIATN